MKKKTGFMMAFGAIALVLPFETLFAGEISVTETKLESGGRAILVENDFYRMRFEPDNGGRLRSLVVKSTGNEQTSPEKHGGFFLDHFVGQEYPGEFMYSSYDCTISKDGTNRVSLEMKRTTTGKKEGAENRLFAGILYQKTITVYSKKPVIDARITITNTTDETKSIGLWLQSCPALGGSPFLNTYYRPTVRGINSIKNDEKGEIESGEEWIKNFIAGWMAGRNEKNNEGMVFLTDFNCLRTFYNFAAQTAEWFLNDIAIPPGKSFTTSYSIRPVQGFAGFAYASPHLIANIEAVPDPTGVTFEHQIAATAEPLKNLTIETAVYKVRLKTTVKLADVAMDEAGLNISRAKARMNEPQEEPVVLRVTVKGSGWTENYEYYCGGGKEGAGIAGYVPRDEYLFTRPKQNVNLLEAKEFKIVRNKVLDVFLLFGLYTNWYGIDKAVETAKPGKLKVSNALPEGADYLPGTNDEWGQYDVIVLSDVNRESLKDIGDLMVRKFVENGGGLLVLGGPNTLGQGNYGGTELLNLISVNILPEFDVRWEKEGAILKPDGKHEILEGVDFTGSPAAYWIHEVTPKEGAQVIIRAGNRPFLTVGKFGKGKVAVMAGTPMGVGLPGQVEFWQWPGWQKILVNTLQWLGREE